MSLVKKEFNFEIKANEPGADGMFRFEAYGSTFGNIDLVDDVMVKGCFKDSLLDRMPIILWQHDRYEPIGMPELIMEDEKGLKISVKMPADDDFVRGRVMPQLRIGSVKAMSIGFMVLDYFLKDGIRYITKALLKEVSLVTFPANEMAEVTSVKDINDYQQMPFADRNHPWNEKEALERLSEIGGGSSNYLWYDREAKDASSPSGLFPFVDIIEGEKHVIPRALFVIEKAIAKSNLPDTDKVRILALNKCYIDKLNTEQPIKMLNVNDLKTLNKKQLEEVLRDSGAFSKDAAVAVASGFQAAGDPPNDNEAAIMKALEDSGLVQKELSEADILNAIENL